MTFITSSMETTNADRNFNWGSRNSFSHSWLLSLSVLALEYLQAKLPTPTIIGQLLENDTIIANITDLKLSAGGNGCHGCYWDIDEHKQQGDDPCLICTNYVYYENSQT